MKAIMRCRFFHVVYVLALWLVLQVMPVHAGTITYTYDAVGRLIRADYGSGRVINYSYDNRGNLLSIQESNPSATTTTTTTTATTTTSTTTTTIAVATTTTTLTTTTSSTTTTATSTTTTTMAPGADGDNDGIPDGQEQGPGGSNPNYDGDGNGIPDRLEGRAASFPTFAGSGYATLAVPAGQSLAGVHAVGNPSPGNAPVNVSFPFGFFEFNIQGLTPGGCTTATLYLPQNLNLTSYYKYGAEAGNAVNHWYLFMLGGGNTTGGQIVQQATRTLILLNFCDGQRGDDILTPDTRIIDQGGPAQPTIPIPLLTATGLLLLLVLITFAALLFLRGA